MPEKHLLYEYISTCETSRQITSVSHRWVDGRCYVTGQGMVGTPRTGDEIILDASFVDRLAFQGTLDGKDGWRARTGILCIGNTILTTCISLAFTGLTLRLINGPNIGLHIHGGSGKGKGSTDAAARSVTGTPYRSWKSSENGSEVAAFESSDNFLSLDEIGQGTPRKALDNAYLIGNGSGKLRYNETTKEWLLAWLSTGEISLPEFAKEHNYKIMPGQEVRLLSIPVDVGKGFGSFDTIHWFRAAPEFADYIKHWAAKNQGVAMHAYLEQVTADTEAATAKLRAHMKVFVDGQRTKHGFGVGTPEIVTRALSHFAIVAANAELASEFEITGWPEGWASEAVAATFELWLNSQYKQVVDENKVMDRVFAFIRENRHRFRERATESAPVDNLAGLHETLADGTELFSILRDVFNLEILKGFNAQAVAERLRDLGHSVCDEGRFMKKTNWLFKPGQDYFYAVKVVPART